MWKKLFSSAPRGLITAAIAMMIGATFVALAAQTNYLGTVFIADSTVPSRQLTITATGEILNRPSASGVVISAGNPSDGLANGIQVFQENDLLSLFNGTTWDRAFTCTSQAQVTVTAAATTEIVPLTASQVIRVCSFSVGMSATGTAQFVQGTGTNCGTGTASITPATSVSTGNIWELASGNGSVFRTGSGNALCVAAVTGNAQVFVSYAKY